MISSNPISIRTIKTWTTIRTQANEESMIHEQSEWMHKNFMKMELTSGNWDLFRIPNEFIRRSFNISSRRSLNLSGLEPSNGNPSLLNIHQQSKKPDTLEINFYVPSWIQNPKDYLCHPIDQESSGFMKRHQSLSILNNQIIHAIKSPITLISTLRNVLNLMTPGFNWIGWFIIRLPRGSIGSPPATQGRTRVSSWNLGWESIMQTITSRTTTASSPIRTQTWYWTLKTQICSSPGTK